MALGDNSSFGGEVSVPFHQDFIFFRPNLEVFKDGQKIELIIDGSRSFKTHPMSPKIYSLFLRQISIDSPLHRLSCQLSIIEASITWIERKRRVETVIAFSKIPIVPYAIPRLLYAFTIPFMKITIE